MIETTTPATNSLSPALAAMAAQLTIPQQYSKFISVAVLGVNEKCRSTVRHIGK